VLVDGNDLLAVVAATSEAVERARRGGGPTLIEALTYRMGPHTTTDDAKRYRHDDDVADWHPRDPLERVRRYLAAEGQWDERWQAELEASASDMVEAAVAEAEALPALTESEIFDAMFETPTSALEAQRRLAMRDRGA
jgi:pyruvate dehydrogenase E1 component alpha subunit